jgi:hypothetical protein
MGVLRVLDDLWMRFVQWKKRIGFPNEKKIMNRAGKIIKSERQRGIFIFPLTNFPSSSLFFNSSLVMFS